MKGRLWLVDRRRELNLTTSQVAIKTGITKQHYSFLENGERGARYSFIIGVRLALALKFDIEDFYNKETEYQAKRELEKMDKKFAS